MEAAIITTKTPTNKEAMAVIITGAFAHLRFLNKL
jgi:hypothetical protein